MFIMRKNYFIGIIAFAALVTVIISCVKDRSTSIDNSFPQATVPGSFVEEFDSVGNLTAKGWVFKNNSQPIGQTGWRQGRYESAVGMQYKFNAPIPFVGFPAYSAHITPNDFVSSDISAVGDSGTISSWLISPIVPMRNGDQIIFYTRASDDSQYPDYTTDRMQVRANATDSSANVGNDNSSVGSFTNLLLDINSAYAHNSPAGYPEAWIKKTITISGLPNAGIAKGRFAFRHYCTATSLIGPHYASVVGIDSLAYIHHD